MTSMTDEQIDISIIIKALNEEKYIARAIESALHGIEGHQGEVILADSLSSDHTVEIASRYPVKIVQLNRPEDRSCGVGPQLGYQYACGRYIYILDGDMILEPEFIQKAINVMRARPDVAGIAGVVKELGGGNYEFEARKARSGLWSDVGEHEWLVMGALYRREAIESVGYFSNFNMHAFEEQELGLRLRNHGWKLIRIETPAVQHHGHTVGTLELMRRRWRSRYLDGPGEILRATWGKPYFWKALKSQRRLVIMTGFWLWFMLSLFIAPWYLPPFLITVIIMLAFFIVTWVKKRSFYQSGIGFLLWPVRVAGLLRGLFRPQRSPSRPITSTVIVSNGLRPC